MAAHYYLNTGWRKYRLCVYSLADALEEIKRMHRHGTLEIHYYSGLIIAREV